MLPASWHPQPAGAHVRARVRGGQPSATALAKERQTQTDRNRHRLRHRLRHRHRARERQTDPHLTPDSSRPTDRPNSIGQTGILPRFFHPRPLVASTTASEYTILHAALRRTGSDLAQACRCTWRVRIEAVAALLDNEGGLQTAGLSLCVCVCAGVCRPAVL